MLSASDRALRSTEMTLSFRPHNFMCALGFQGMGYSPAFVENFTSIVDALHHNEGLPIQIIGEFDSICAACPNNRGLACKDEEKIRSLDERHSKVLGLLKGTSITWNEAKKLMKKNMTLEAFHKACEGCSWKSLGVCEKALQALRTDGKEA